MCHYYDNLQGRHTEICTHTREGSVQEHLGTDRNPVRKPRVFADTENGREIKLESGSERTQHSAEQNKTDRHIQPIWNKYKTALQR